MEPDREIDAMAAIAGAFSTFGEDEEEVVKRIARWVAARYGGSASGHAAAPQPPTTPAADDRKQPPHERFEHLAELLDAAAPATDPQRVLVVSYWVTQKDGDSEFTAQTVNSKLKDLGFGVSNITNAFDSLIKRKPALVIQTAKKGKSRQARKRYKLTNAGDREVQRMIRSEPKPGA